MTFSLIILESRMGDEVSTYVPLSEKFASLRLLLEMLTTKHLNGEE